MSNRNKSLKKISGLLGKESVFEGTLKFYGIMQLDGHFKGKIAGEGTLLIGKTARITGDIHATSVICQGEVKGDIFAEEKIGLRVPGQVFGNIEAPGIEIEKGVVFQGQSRPRKPQQLDTEALAMKESLRFKGNRLAAENTIPLLGIQGSES